MRQPLLACGARIIFALLVFAVLATAILLRPAKWLSDFDQSFYLTIAYDLDHHGVFSNGMFDDVNSTRAAPPPGKFFGPVYPWLILAATKIDARFAKAVDCGVEANHQRRERAECELYARPMHIMHAALLALGVVAIALAAEIIFASGAVFWLAGILATLALLPDADLFAFVMTESVTFSLYSVAALALVLALQVPRVPRVMLAGCLFGLLCLTRPSFAVLAPVVVGLLAVNGFWLSRAPWRTVGGHVLVFALAWVAIVGPWLARNAVSVGTWGLTEEYGSAALIERFAYDDMSAREFALAFPVLPAGDRRARDRPGIREAGHGTVRLLHAQELLPRRPRASRQAGRGARPARSADQGRDPRRAARARLALSRGERAAGPGAAYGSAGSWGSRLRRCSQQRA